MLHAARNKPAIAATALLLVFTTSCGGSDDTPITGPPPTTEPIHTTDPPWIPDQPPSGLSPSTPLVTIEGDSVEVSVKARDDVAMSYMGYRLGPPANLTDSTTGRWTKSGSAALWFRVQSGWVGESQVTVFARDCIDPVGRCDPDRVGQLGSAVVDTLVVAPSKTRQQTAVPMPGWAGDWTFDAKRNRLYISQRDSLRINVFSLTSLRWEPSINLPAHPFGIDTSISEDTLLVAFASDPPVLGVIDLTLVSPQLVDLIVLDFGPRWVDIQYKYAEFVKVAANGKAVISINSDDFTGGDIMTLDLATGAQLVRDDVSPHSQRLTWLMPLTRSHDRSRVMVLADDACCPVLASVYDAASDQFTPLMPVTDGFFPSTSASADGSAFMVNGEVFDSSLNPIADLDWLQFDQEFTRWPRGALSHDGSKAYFSTRYGYVAIDVAQKQIIERVRTRAYWHALVPRHAMTLMTTPDGSRLIMRSDYNPVRPEHAELTIVELP